MKKNPNHEFLAAAARDYLKASAAIAKFGDVVYECGVNVLRRRVKELSDSTGLQLNAGKISKYQKDGYIYTGLDGTDASIGPLLPLVGQNKLNLYAWWRTSDEREGVEICSAVASVGCKTVNGAENLFQALRSCSKGQVKKDVDVNKYEVYIEKLLKPDDFVRLESHFDELVKQWLGYAKRIGGLKKYLQA